MSEQVFACGSAARQSTGVSLIQCHARTTNDPEADCFLGIDGMLPSAQLKLSKLGTSIIQLTWEAEGIDGLAVVRVRHDADELFVTAHSR